MLRNANIEVVQAWINIRVPGEPGNEAMTTQHCVCMCGSNSCLVDSNKYWGRVGNIYTVTQDTHTVAMIPDMAPEVWIGVSAP